MFFEAECVLAGRGGLSFYVKGNGRLKKKKKNPWYAYTFATQEPDAMYSKKKTYYFQSR